MKQRPSGICTQLYRCPKCGAEQYQPVNADVTHPCPTTNTHIQLKEVKS